MTTALSKYSLEIRPTGCARPNIPISTAALYLVRAYGMVVQKYKNTVPKFDGIKLCIRKDAPETMKGLLADVEAGYLAVSPEHSDQSIYGQIGNMWFRWMHDMGHVATGLRMHHKGEVELARYQLADVILGLQAQGLPEKDVAFCAALYMADSAGQSDYLDVHGDFPVDQREFVKDTVTQWGWVVHVEH